MFEPMASVENFHLRLKLDETAARKLNANRQPLDGKPVLPKTYMTLNPKP